MSVDRNRNENVLVVLEYRMLFVTTVPWKVVNGALSTIFIPPRRTRLLATTVFPEIVEPGEPKMTIPPSTYQSE